MAISRKVVKRTIRITAVGYDATSSRRLINYKTSADRHIRSWIHLDVAEHIFVREAFIIYVRTHACTRARTYAHARTLRTIRTYCTKSSHVFRQREIYAHAHTCKWLQPYVHVAHPYARSCTLLRKKINWIIENAGKVEVQPT